MDREQQFLASLAAALAASKKQREEAAQHWRDIGQIGFHKELEYAPLNQALH